jgi:hypothetical protein
MSRHVSMSASMFPCPRQCSHVHVHVLIHVHVHFVFMYIFMSISMYITVHIDVHIRAERKTPTSVCLLQTENGNDQLPFVCCKWKRKTEVCFPWSANDKR